MNSNHNTNRLMIMEFSRFNLWKYGGFTTQKFISMLELLPHGTEIRGFSEVPDRDNYRILLSHDSFPELQEAQRFPEITGIINRHYKTDGSFTESIELKWPEEYKNNHTCQYKTYQGFATMEEICTICGKKK